MPLFLAAPWCAVLQIKCRLQAQSSHFKAATSHAYRGLAHGLASVYASEGVRGLFRGATAAMMRVCVGSAVQLSSYDVLKDVLRVHAGMGGTGATCVCVLSFVRPARPASQRHHQCVFTLA